MLFQLTPVTAGAGGFYTNPTFCMNDGFGPELERALYSYNDGDTQYCMNNGFLKTISKTQIWT